MAACPVHFKAPGFYGIQEKGAVKDIRVIDARVGQTQGQRGGGEDEII